MSEPAPLTLKTPFAKFALPARPTDPMSCVVHGAGTLPPPPPPPPPPGSPEHPLLAPVAVNERTDDEATIDDRTGVAFVRETICQKYVVPVQSEVGGVHEYVVGGSLINCAATFAMRVRFDERPR